MAAADMEAEIFGGGDTNAENAGGQATVDDGLPAEFATMSADDIARRARLLDNDADYVTPADMLAELREDNLQLAGEMPSLPSQNSTLRAALMANKPYMDGLMEVSDVLGGWIEAAQKDGTMNAQVPAIAILYTLFARACDPVLEFLKMGGLHDDAQIIDLVMATCFDGLNARAAPPNP